jgi:hypothetical protein
MAVVVVDIDGQLKEQVAKVGLLNASHKIASGDCYVRSIPLPFVGS